METHFFLSTFCFPFLKLFMEQDLPNGKESWVVESGKCSVALGLLIGGIVILWHTCQCHDTIGFFILNLINIKHFLT